MICSPVSAGVRLWLLALTVCCCASPRVAFAQEPLLPVAPSPQFEDDDEDDADGALEIQAPVVFTTVGPTGGIVVLPGAMTPSSPGTPAPATPVLNHPVTIGPVKPDVAGNRRHPPVTYNLPSEYADKDKDHDGQIGLYEWSRTDLPAFQKLDLDGDGFLTPFEILKAMGKIPSTVTFARSVQIIPVSAGVSAAPVSGSDFNRSESGRGEGRGEGGRRGRDGGRRGGSRDEGGSGATTESTTRDPATRDPATQRAEWAFTQMDRDRNDKIDQEEWSRSRTVRTAVEKANLTVVIPLGKAEFVELFKKSNTTP